jgi:hypothetical protein
MPERQRLLELALKGLEADRVRVDDEIAQIRKELGLSGRGSTTTIASAGADGQPRKRRTMSAAARKRISEGMKRRYAELRKAAGKLK